MNIRRIIYSLRLCTIPSGFKRAEYLKKHRIFRTQGEHCMFMFRKIPLYPEMISVGNNVHLAVNCSLLTHDVVHSMLNYKSEKQWSEYIGSIVIGDNVFVGGNTTILYDVTIPSNTIIGACSLVNRSLPSGGVYAGVPARYICSIEDFLKKREDYNIKIVKKNECLSPETRELIWKRYDERKKH